MKRNHLYVFIMVMLCSCAKRNLAYFSDSGGKSIHIEKIQNASEPRIQPNDLLAISVNSLSPEANTLFNMGVVVGAENSDNLPVTNVTNIEGYLVDREGFIRFPVLGKVRIGGLTKELAHDTLVARLQSYVKDPIVNIRFMNYRVTVVGEVNRPSTFTIPSERINVLEALGLAGDMTVYGKRENVLILREEGGTRTMARINLNNKDVLNSPYFYLQQNDVVYVEPDRLKHVNASTNVRTLSIITAITSVAVIVVSRIF